MDANLKLQLTFLNLIDKVAIQMFTNDVGILTNVFDKIMASDKLDKITLFSGSFREKLNDSRLLFMFLLPFMTWFDHSILKEMVEYSNNKEAIEVLDQFDSCIDYDEPIKSCIPEVSYLIIPYKGNESDYTLLVTKHYYSKDHDEMVLHDLLNIKEELTQLWGITCHALQLVAMHSKSSYFYWMFSKQIQPLIEKGINEGQNALWNKGIIATILSEDILSYKDIQTIEIDFSTTEVGNFFICQLLQMSLITILLHILLCVCTYIRS